MNHELADQLADLQRQLEEFKAVYDQHRHDMKQLRQAMGCDGSDLPQLFAAWDKLTEENERLSKEASWIKSVTQTIAGIEAGLAFQGAEAGGMSSRIERVMAHYQAEIERLGAELAKYPVTGDGVRIFPGMELWQRPGLIAGRDLPVRHVPVVLVDAEGMLGEVEEYAWTFYARDCFSTEAAAEAAQEEGKDV